MTAAPKPSNKPKSTVTVATKGKGTTAPQNAPKKVGAPKGSGSKYTEEIADKICDLVSNGVNLRSVCRIQGMPAWRTVYDWVVARPEFAARLARARELGYDAIAEEALEISNTPVMGQKQVMGDSKTYTTVEDMLGHRKLQIETRLKLLACWDPKKYGNRTTLAGDAQNPVVIDAAKEAKDLLEALLLNVELNKQAKINS